MHTLMILKTADDLYQGDTEVTFRSVSSLTINSGSCVCFGNIIRYERLCEKITVA